MFIKANLTYVLRVKTVLTADLTTNRHEHLFFSQAFN